MEYKNLVIAAPMVRVSTLPFRELCLDYGASLAYSEVFDNMYFRIPLGGLNAADHIDFYNA